MSDDSPKFSRRAVRHRKETMRSGRTISERREKLETASERLDAHKKIRRAEISKIVFTIAGFLLIIAILIFIGKFFFIEREERPGSVSVVVPYAPTVEVLDAETGAPARLSSRMKEYIGEAESDFKDLGYKATRVVIPSGAIREVDFYLDGRGGCIKMLLDRGTGVSVEDADRMLRYLTSIGVTDFEYIDVRLPGKAYWR